MKNPNTFQNPGTNIKLETGKMYRMRNGKHVKIVTTGSNDNIYQPNGGIVRDHQPDFVGMFGNGRCGWYYENGQYAVSWAPEYDIVSEKKFAAKTKSRGICNADEAKSPA